jgi:hypothetical protein
LLSVSCTAPQAQSIEKNAPYRFVDLFDLYEIFDAPNRESPSHRQKWISPSQELEKALIEAFLPASKIIPW